MNNNIRQEDYNFITNIENNTLENKVDALLKQTKQLDILVGYFRLSGFDILKGKLDGVDKIRIIVGLNTDSKVVDMLQEVEKSMISTGDIKKNIEDTLTTELNEGEDSLESDTGAKTFLQLLKEGKVEIRGYKERNMHAKMYVFTFKEGNIDKGRVITGSSNLSYMGLRGQLELNVELKNNSDYRFATDTFKYLWENSVPVNKEFEDKVEGSWVRDDMHPKLLYLRTLQELFKEELESGDKSRFEGEGYKTYRYQLDAVSQAEEIIDNYGGVFISDVVGLGKTYITSMLTAKLGLKPLVICPPHLISNWRGVMDKFGVSCEIESIGKLDNILHRMSKYKNICNIVVIDESHRFKNQSTLRYEQLHAICANKKVILVTATALNNVHSDIESQLYLFQSKYNSNILSETKNLQGYFKNLEKRLKDIDKNNKQKYKQELKLISEKIRTDILSKIMIRRTRHDIEKLYKNDMIEQDLIFPEVMNPQHLEYVLSGESERKYDTTIRLLSLVSFDVYNPWKYSDREKERKKNINLVGFMKALAIKRLESSSYAFKSTIESIINNHESFLKIYTETGKIRVIRDDKVEDLVLGDEELDEGILDGMTVDASKFKGTLVTEVKKDLDLLKDIKNLWEKETTDYKWEMFKELLNNREEFKNNKLVIFTEYADTAEYLNDKIKKEVTDKVYKFTGKSKESNREKIKRNFDAASEEQENEIDILVTTDTLSEGINLHRSNTIINYDIPWNPTKIIQRVGRINRINTVFNKLYIYNFLPSKASEKHLDMSDRILNKLQSFHDILGEDSKYLSDLEEIGSKELYGMMNDISILEEGLSDKEREVASPLSQRYSYLKEIRDIKENNIELYKEVLKIPIKSRCAKESNREKNSLVTFFKKGKKSIFVISKENGSQEEIPFNVALELMRSDDDTVKLPLDLEEYYKRLYKNKTKVKILEERNDKETIKRSKNTEEVLERLKYIPLDKTLTDRDIEKIKSLISLIKVGDVSDSIINEINKICKLSEDNFLKVEKIFRTVPSTYFTDKGSEEEVIDSAKVILSMFLK